MIFPNKTIRIGKCLASIRRRKYKTSPANAPVLNKVPTVFYNGKPWQGHRLSYHLNTKKIPRQPNRGAKVGLILHTCDHFWCVESDHLYKGSQANNMQDLSSRHPTIRETRSRNMKGKRYSLGFRHSDEVKEARSKALKRAWRKGKFNNRNHNNQWTNLRG